MFRSRSVLEDWLEEYADLLPDGAPARLAAADEVDGGTGIVTRLRDGATTVVVQPTEDGERWTVTIEAQPQATQLTGEELVRLADEFVSVAELCAFLEHKSRHR